MFWGLKPGSSARAKTDGVVYIPNKWNRTMLPVFKPKMESNDACELSPFRPGTFQKVTVEYNQGRAQLDLNPMKGGVWKPQVCSQGHSSCLALRHAPAWRESGPSHELWTEAAVQADIKPTPEGEKSGSEWEEIKSAESVMNLSDLIRSQRK